MRTWLAKFRVSAVLDDSKPSAVAATRLHARSDEVRRFAESSAALERALQQSLPSTEAPAGLHAAIMRSVLRSEPSASKTGPWAWLRWLPAPALGLLLVAGLWWGWQHAGLLRARRTQPLAIASQALDLGGEMPAKLPAVTEPLAEELARLNQDLDRTAQFLQASVP